MVAVTETLNESPIDSFQVQWDERVTVLKEEQAKPTYRYGNYYDGFYERCRETGRAIIQEIWQRHSGETLAQILAGIQNLNLKTQIELLKITATDDVNYLIAALNSLALPDEQEDKRQNKDNWLQEVSYRRLVNHMLRQKFPDQDPTSFEAKLPVLNGLIHWEPTSVMTIALARGPQRMVDIFEFISPEELSSSNFEKRLELEKKARGSGSRPVEKTIICKGQIQDVGFRSFCSSIARVWGVTGFARNESDGSVTVVLQEYPEILDAYEQDFQEESKNWENQPSVAVIREVEIEEGGRITGFHSLYVGQTMESVQPIKIAGKI